MIKNNKKYIFPLLTIIILAFCVIINIANGYETAQSSILQAGVVNTDNAALKMRENSSTDANVVALLRNNEQVQILSEENEFYKISVKTSDDGHVLYGYVKKEYISTY